MKGNLVNPFKDKYPHLLSFSMTILLLALTFFLSMIIAFQSRTIYKISEKLEKKVTGIKLTQKVEDWKIYTNSQLGFSIEYPDYPDGVEIRENNNIVQIYKKAASGPYEYREFPEFQIKIIENEIYQAKVDWIKTQSDIRVLLTDDLYSNVKWENYGEWLVSSEPIATFGNENYAYMFTGEKIIQATSTKPRGEFIQILSTLTLLTDIPNKKMSYSDGNYNFSFQTPTNYFTSDINNGVMIADKKWENEYIHHPFISFTLVESDKTPQEIVEQEISNLKSKNYGILEEGCTINPLQNSIDLI